MTIAVTAPDNSVHNFPDNTPTDVIKGTMSKYVRYSGALGAAGAAGRGLVASTLASMSAPTPVDQNYGAAKDQGGMPYSGLETLERILPKPELGQIHPTAQTVGEVLPAIGAAADLGISGAGLVKNSVTASRLGRFLPGAMGRAEHTITEIGPISDVKMSQLGDKMVSDLRGRFDQMVKNRAALADEAEKKLGGFWKNNQEAVSAARKIAFREASKGINKFSQQNALGKIVSGNLSPYSDVERVAHSTVPSAAFKDAQRVRDLRELLGGDQKQVERYAGEYAATKIQNAIDSVKPPIGKPRLPGSTIANMAKVAEKWQRDNEGWLNEAPVTQAAVQFSVDQLKAAARAASNIRASAVGAGALAALYEMGSNAGYWIRYGVSKL